ncbi:hypothetical protein [Acidianus bottle-shaped virus 3 strain ABV3]|uniref:Uncharacterized protein n=1 Tax=Acidianus bottle-shaped virus 3 strain ABV3 TaxID=1732174 RepID=A0A0N9PAZ4_9VIRU|nr:hypothetical protein AVU00_gp17 [Acidianus bottle-shaped virus 3 strain ABV3]ALG96819.1 hypothetical protein [Acidianus bottle-shaped virus 3 strain ABV3]
MSERLKKYFTDEEIQFIEQLAKQKGLKETDVIYALAREMIQTYQLRYVSGQQVLAMLDLLAMKLPQWFALQLNLVGQSSLQVTTLSKQLSALTQPSTFDKIIELLKTTDAQKLLSMFAPILANLFSSPQKREDDNTDTTPPSNNDNQNSGEWL